MIDNMRRSKHNTAEGSVHLPLAKGRMGETFRREVLGGLQGDLSSQWEGMNSNSSGGSDEQVRPGGLVIKV
ncbi:hypothetical protein ACLOJK_037494 [Asimina triloba]